VHRATAAGLAPQVSVLVHRATAAGLAPWVSMPVRSSAAQLMHRVRGNQPGQPLISNKRGTAEGAGLISAFGQQLSQ